MRKFSFVGIRIAIAVLFTAGFISAQAQPFVAVDDNATTGPLRKLRINVLLNDTIPCSNPTLGIVQPVPAATLGTIEVKSGGYIEFTPRLAARNSTVQINYSVSCSGKSVKAKLTIRVSEYNYPVNVVPVDIVCYDTVKTVTFSPDLKYISGNDGVDLKKASTDLPLDGFSLPLVGDINGDGKPEIIALGLGTWGSFTDGTGLEGRAWYVHIFDGQTGVRLWSVNFGPDNSGHVPLTSQISYLGHAGIIQNSNDNSDQFQLRYDPRHNSPGHLAIADLDNDGKAEIVVVETGSMGRIYALTPRLGAKREIIGFSKMWEGNDNGAAYSYKDPLARGESVSASNLKHFGAGIPYIADINGDGKPEVIVYNKIFDGLTGNKVCVLETLDHFSFTTNSNDNKTRFNSYAFVGRRVGLSWDEDGIPCMAIADINADGILDIIAGSKVYIMKDSGGKPALDRIIAGPSEVKMQKGKATAETTTQVNDGFTAVADIDGDGLLDVVVIAPAKNNTYEDMENLIYVWTPMSSSPTTPKAAMYLYTRSGLGSISYPFIGDINGRKDDYTGKKRLPEICLNVGVLQTNHANSSKIARHPLSTGLTLDGNGFLNNAGFNQASSASGRGHVIAFTFHANENDPVQSNRTPLHQRLKLSWAMEHLDMSSQTGITMFDFDNDGVKELVYRDELSLRVISPAGGKLDYVSNSYVNSPPSADIVRFSQPGVRSYTGSEAPVIADVNMDGSADIVTMAVDPSLDPTNTSRLTWSRSFVYVFEHASGTPKWAPCPPVWNQTIYYPLYINEDLTVPARPQSMLKEYIDPHTKEKIMPYNGHWIQQPIVKDRVDYSPVVRKPDAVITDMQVAVQNPQNIAKITLTILNKGAASISSSTPIAFYNGGTRGASTQVGAGATPLYVHPVGVDIFPGEVQTLTYTLTGINFNNRLIWARIMDAFGAFPANGYDDCDPKSNLMGGADCPTFKYTVKAARKLFCGAGDSIRLVARAAAAQTAPVFAWYLNGVAINGAVDSVFYAKSAGVYRCYVIDDICRGYSSEETISWFSPSAYDDRTSTMMNIPAKIDVLANDNLSPCRPTLSIVTNPMNGAAVPTATNDGIVYTPHNNFIGHDTLVYGFTVGNSTVSAKVYITVSNLPDNMGDAKCYTNPPTSGLWTIGRAFKSKENDKFLSNNISPVAGDIDGDKIPEIFVAKYAGNNRWKDIYVFSGANRSNPRVITTVEGDVNSFGMALAKLPNGVPIIVMIKGCTTQGSLQTNDGRIYAYNALTGQQLWISSARISGFTANLNNNNYSLQFVDFDGDGTLELVAGKDIFAAESGVRLLTSPGNGGFASASKNVWAPWVADIDGDGKPEYIAGTEIYKVHIDRQNSGNSSISLLKSIPAQSFGGVNIADGMTQTADFNGDGQADILVACPVSAKNIAFFVWDYSTGTVYGSVYLANATSAGNMSMPAVGNIDENKNPEVLTVVDNRIKGWSYKQGQANAFSQTEDYDFPINDPSGETGLILFDFNQDGKNELVYRGEEFLYILQADTLGRGTRRFEVKDSIECKAGTGVEHPIVIDADSEGTAAIVTLGGTGGTGANGFEGWLYIFKSQDDSPWAPARKVWNQYQYNVLNINENLSVPPARVGPATIFPGKDGTLGTASDLQPFNNFMQQQTLLDANGNPIWPTPDVELDGAPSFTYDATGDSLLVVVPITNTGDALFQPPSYISVYKDSVMATNFIASNTLATAVRVKAKSSMTLTAHNFSSYLPATSITVRINDRGEARYVQPECDTTNNNMIRLLILSLPLANNDTVSTGTCATSAPLIVDVLANDHYNCQLANLTVNIISAPKQGSAFFDNFDRIVYTFTNSGYVGTDTVTYQIECGGNISIAHLLVKLERDSDAFADDLWYFGNAASGSGSPGIVFKKNSAGKYVPEDASGISKVNTYENSLVISSPYCDGQLIFYSHHDQLFNSLHEPMQNGSIPGNSSCADGLAVCYMGDNKYLMLSVTGAHNDPTRGLNAYLIDMNADNGKGAIIAPSFTIEPDDAAMSESIELIPRAGTATEYWLIYRFGGELRCRLVDVLNTAAPVAASYTTMAITNNLTHKFVASPSNDHLALVYPNTGELDVIDFDNVSGQLSNRRIVGGLNRTYSVAFSPSGKYLYASEYEASPTVRQYDVSQPVPALIGTPITYWNQAADPRKGGGLKLGPDGKIYVVQALSDYVGVISDPDSISDPNTRYDIHGFKLDVPGGMYLAFSTGLSRPDVIACSHNLAPVARPDSDTICGGGALDVLLNDYDPDGNNVYLTGARFKNEIDTLYARLIVNPAHGSISVTPKSNGLMPSNHLFEIEYEIKDDGFPASICASGIAHITIRQPVSYPDVRLHLCPSPDRSIFLSGYLDTLYLKRVKWNEMHRGTVSFVPGTDASTGELRTGAFSLGTHIYRYDAVSECSTGSGKVYIKVLSRNSIALHPDTVVVCHTIPSSAYMQLNQILGLEIDGTWSYNADLNPYVTVYAAPSNFVGAHFFDAQKAWADGKGTPGRYKSDPLARRYEFTYTPGQGGCLSDNSPRKMVLIVTNKLMP
ncbi:MAG: hypothetical protein LBC98_07225 [Prevotellaceae bacterium]|jgi:hypothetical protein|nr:hypothetical protein [Prevotellaceae bacterium]